MFGDSGSAAPVVMRCEPLGERHFIMVLDENCVETGRTLEDLEDELTIFGYMDRVVGEGQSVPLDRYLLPGLNRTLRRAAGDLSQMVQDAPGVKSIVPSDLVFDGPGGLIKAAAIY